MAIVRLKACSQLSFQNPMFAGAISRKWKSSELYKIFSLCFGGSDSRFECFSLGEIWREMLICIFATLENLKHSLHVHQSYNLINLVAPENLFLFSDISSKLCSFDRVCSLICLIIHYPTAFVFESDAISNLTAAEKYRGE